MAAVEAEGGVAASRSPEDHAPIVEWEAVAPVLENAAAVPSNCLDALAAGSIAQSLAAYPPLI